MLCQPMLTRGWSPLKVSTPLPNSSELWTVFYTCIFGRHLRSGLWQSLSYFRIHSSRNIRNLCKAWQASFWCTSLLNLNMSSGEILAVGRPHLRSVFIFLSSGLSYCYISFFPPEFWPQLELIQKEQKSNYVVSLLLLLVSDSITPVLLTASISPNLDGLQDQSQAVSLFLTNLPQSCLLRHSDETLRAEARLWHVPPFIMRLLLQVHGSILHVPHPYRKHARKDCFLLIC